MSVGFLGLRRRAAPPRDGTAGIRLYVNSSGDLRAIDEEGNDSAVGAAGPRTALLVDYLLVPYASGGYQDIPTLSGFATVAGVVMVANQRTLETGDGPSLFFEWSPSPEGLILFKRLVNTESGEVTTAEVEDDYDPDALVTLLVIEG